MTDFLCLGSGSSGNSYLLKNGNTCILIDAGIGIRTLKKTLKEYGFPLDHIDAVLITHDHADHIKAVGHLANDHNKPIYATEMVHMGINRNYCISSKLTSKHQHTVNKGQATQIGNFLVTPFEVSHDSTDCVGYKIEAEGITFCLITDCGHITAQVAQAVSEAQYLVIESNHEESMVQSGPYPAYLKSRILSNQGHLSNRQCADALVSYATPLLRHVWLCHLSEENNHPELAKKTVDQILRSNGIVVGKDFEVEVLKRKTPSGPFLLQEDHI
ncbi:MAG: MBL fold metallo-hydrolase [Bacteroidaceae bacterium]|nr:MBL fold metallo-hydrolase [Prevotellaceae bacterium]MDY5631678.1 MBL fold metallo-hydrolase [Bacteroidaceae bacterium]